MAWVRRVAGGFCVAGVACLSLPAHALFGDDEARKAILELRGKIAEMEKRQQELTQSLVGEQGKRIDRLEQAQRGALDFANQMDALRQDVAKLRGQIEQLTNDLAAQQKRSRDLYSDLDARLKKLEPQAVTVDGRTAQVDPSEQGNFDAALAQFRASDFRGAVTSLQSFVARFPRSPYTAAAQFWLGNSYYALKDYKAAISAQQSVVEQFPDSPRVPEALLNIAACQTELNQRTAAKATLQKIIKEFPDAEAAKVARERLAAK